MAWYKVQQQPWRRWPKVLVVERESDDGLEYRRYVPETEVTRLREENGRLRGLLQRTWDAFHGATAREFVTVKNDLRELGVVVDA